MSARTRQLVRDERGAVLPLAALLLLGLVAVAGLVADGGTVLVQRRALQQLADAAAAAGAMQLDEATYRASGGATVALDASAAEGAAIAILIDEDGTDYAVSAARARVEVRVSREATTAFLRVLGVDRVPISASSVAEPRFGVGGP